MLDNMSNILGSAVGSTVFVVFKDEIPMWKRIVFCILGFLAASLTTEALVDFYHLSAGMSGGIGFFIAVTVIPVANSLINFAENPAKLVEFVRGLMGKKENDNDK